MENLSFRPPNEKTTLTGKNIINLFPFSLQSEFGGPANVNEYFNHKTQNYHDNENDENKMNLTNTDSNALKNSFRGRNLLGKEVSFELKENIQGNIYNI